eukprot:MONOS_13537.1-p1 / transcript=MONOS_13537.1 / gene=MONOS_13537 / organism=Monocercomonoides_exilis_PA203 / gene_product=unspecified product / transcript_product=unspecified product / location=Mono_scaffold00841:24612-25669(+) / protein_length=332 / sequence_SO=supercontig / SO=protein_coding / is_pseudo=false
MLVDEDKKNEEKNEKLLADFCECYLLLCDKSIPDELLSIVVHCLLKVASKKEGNEETQKEVEIAMLCFNCIDDGTKIEQKLYLNEISEIIKYHQEHHNLTQLAYQSSWKFLINRFFNNISLEEVIVNELHFTREARREIEDMFKSVNWKRKEEGKGEKEVKEMLVIERWLLEIKKLISSCTLWNEECSGLIRSICQVFQASRDDHPDISHVCIISLRNASDKKNMEIDVLQKEGVMDVFLEEMNQSTLDDENISHCLNFFLDISERLKEKKDDGETDETKRIELKRKIFEKMEEEGYEDIIAGFHEMFDFLNRSYVIYVLSLNVSDYFVNA